MLGLHFRVCRAMTGHPFKVVKDRSCGVVRDRSACTLEHSMYRKVKGRCVATEVRIFPKAEDDELIICMSAKGKLNICAPGLNLSQ